MGLLNADGAFVEGAMQYPDLLCYRPAEALAQTISRYWIARGYLGIKTHLEPARLDSSKIGPAAETLYLVRSNIGPLGFPPPTSCDKTHKRGRGF